MTQIGFSGKAQATLIYSLAFLISLTPLLGALAPRALAILPALTGLIGIIGYRLIEKKWPVFPPFLLLTCVCIPLWAMLGSLWAYEPSASFERSLKLIPLMLGVALLVATASNYSAPLKRTLNLIWPYMLIAAGAIICLNLYAGSPIYALTHPDWVAPDSGDTSYLNRGTIVYVFGIMIIAYMMAGQKIFSAKDRIIAGILAILTLAILYRTSSQSAQMGIIVFIFILFLLPVKWKRGWKFLSLSAVALMVLMPPIVQFLYFYFADIMAQTPLIKRGFAANRFEIWDFVSRRALEKPLLGHGIEATRSIKDFDIENRYHSYKTVLHPHNFVVQIWIEFGLMGILLTVFWLRRLIKKIWHQALTRDVQFQMAILLSVLAIACTGYGMWQGWWIGLIAIITFMMVVFTERAGAKEPENQSL
jgi:O-antigen ligase